MVRNKILIVDDDAGVRFGIRDFLESSGYTVEEAETVAAAQRIYRSSRPDLAILDYLLPDGNALTLLPLLRDIDSSVPMVILTGHGSIELAVRAIKEGAEQFLTKPLELPALLAIVERLLENHRNRQKQLAGRSQQQREGVDPFVGRSRAIRELSDKAARVVDTDSPVLILGPTGSGKGVLARWLHQAGPRAEEPFVDLNCAGLSREFLETELFGHEKGAFTGAVMRKVGLFEVAHRGTMFLDEIGDVDANVQPKLLKVLEEKRFRRLGETKERQVDVRLVAATHHDLPQLVRDSRFRSDLYFRISTFPLEVPPLRERTEDLPLLASELLRRLATDLGRGEPELSADAMAALQSYAWPGNIRELRNVLERAMLLSSQPVLERRDLRFEGGVVATGGDYGGELTLEALEKLHIERVLREEEGRVVKAAQRLGIPRSSLYAKIKQYEIPIEK